MSDTAYFTTGMDPDIKARADALFDELGMDMATAFNVFIRQTLREGRIPFEIALDRPNKETIAAMLEAERIAHDPTVKGSATLEELHASLENDED